MPFVPSYERQAWEEGIQKGIQEGIHRSVEIVLKVKFGDEGKALAAEVRKIHNVEHLEHILQSVDTKSLDELKKVIQISP